MPPKRKKKFVAKPRPTAPQPNVLRKQIVTGVLIASALALVVTAINKISHLESKQITGVEVIGGRTIPKSQIEQIVNETLVGDYYRLIPKRFVFTYPEHTITENILRLDRVKSAKVTLKDTTVVVVFEEHIPMALWCTESDVQCHFIDQSGLAFALAPELSGGAFIRYAESGREPEKGTVGFGKDFLSANELFTEQLQSELGLYVTHIVKAGDYDTEYTVSGGGVIKVSQTVDLEQSFKNLRSILQSEDFIHLESGTFQYIDLRFGDKVFVNEEVGSADSASSSLQAEE